MPTKSRNISVELLRVLFMLSIVILHSIIYRDGDICNLQYGLLGLSHIGVSGFIFISGYYGIRLKWRKLWNIYTQALFYSVIIAILGLCIWNEQFIKVALHFCMPISRSEWFVMDYVVLMLLAPFIESDIEKIKQQTFLGIVLFISAMLYVGRFWSFDSGTSFMLMLDIYLIGRYIKHYPLKWTDARVRTLMIIALVMLFVLPFGFSWMGMIKLRRIVLSNYNIFALLASGSMVVLADRKPLYTTHSISLGANVLSVFLITESANIRNLLWGGQFAEFRPFTRMSIILAALFGCMMVDQLRQWTIVPLTDKIWTKIKTLYENR